MIKFHLIYNKLNYLHCVSENTFEKEANLKDLVIRLLKEKNLSDFDMLDSLFTEIKQELQKHQKIN